MNTAIKKFTRSYFFRIFAIVTSLVLISCSTIHRTEPAKPESFKLVSIFPDHVHPSVSFDESIMASPLMDFSQGKPLLIVPASNGEIAALDVETGAVDWQITVPIPEGQHPQLVATPAIIGSKLVVLYQCLEKGVRTSHRLAVIDLAKKKLDETFPVLIFSAEKPAIESGKTVKFNPATAFSHSAVKHVTKPGSKLGTVYAAFGNAGDTQPYHGWIFEIDMDAWQSKGIKQAVSSVLLTTPEAECPVTVAEGTQEMICGGGVWTPAGPQIYGAGDDYELFVPTGNGQIDLARHDYANTVMRVKPGLQFDPGCDRQLCENFNPANPDNACISSCKNLFIPRLGEHDAPLKPAGGECDHKSFSECLAWMDYDLGANAPVKVTLDSGHSVLVQPGKDGGVYLIDAEHLGTQHDRLQIVDLCGTKSDPCRTPWMGMIVTQPVLTSIDGTPVVVIPTFNPDKTHPAGLVALKIIIEKGKPKLKRFWQFSGPTGSEALQSFRSHPSLPVISSQGDSGEPIVWIVDIGINGMVYGIRVKDGLLVAKASLKGAGRQLSAPLIYDNKLYVGSIMPSTGKAMIEAFRIELGQ